MRGPAEWVLCLHLAVNLNLLRILRYTLASVYRMASVSALGLWAALRLLLDSGVPALHL